MKIVSIVLLVAMTTPTSQYYYDYTNDDYYGDPPASDCVYEYSSRTSKEGTFTSPHYPNSYPPNQRCKYIFQAQGMERVQVEFVDVDLNGEQSSTALSDCDESQQDTILVKVRIKDDNRDIGRYCGTANNRKLMSRDQKLEVIFVSHDLADSTARGFNATYKFVTDYGITSGKQNESKVCEFEFHSHKSSNGTFTSPNFPGMYPRNTMCLYKFFGDTNENVHITFPFFDVEGVPPNCDAKTKSDYVEFSNFDIPDRKMSRFCGVTRKIKKFVQSDGQFFQVVFRSNDVYDGRGFEALYQFRRTDSEKSPGSTDSSRLTGASSALTLGTSLLGVLFVVLYSTLVS